ncbi:APC family permease [Fertoebacter nigrum]|uniref:APC family permease n=1 Tax=Fertoeibacter niger TaxID=2656921 RepID=A0A8X8H666_9RHOB|nr:APC family permease [Fertoeibacter niger]NUB46433.1 APC family permease [Fertoeibacter niger]
MNNAISPEANRLKKNAIGLGLLVFMVISAAAPLTGIAGAIPIAMLLGNGAGIPGTFILMAIVLAIWGIGFVALARNIRNAGAFYAYSARALGGRFGGAIALMAVLAYNAMMVGLLGLLGGVAAGVFGQFGLNLPWWGWSLIATAIIGILGYKEAELSAKVLMVLVVLEVLIGLVVAVSIVAKGGAGDLTYNILDPSLIFVGGGTVAAILFTFGSFIGIEATAIYAEEVRDADRTVPKATFLAIFLIGVFYAFVTWTMVVATGIDALVPTIAALPDPTLYLFTLAEQYSSGTTAMILGVLLVSSVFASALAMHNFIARYFYVSGREGLLPSFMGVTHSSHQSPHVGSVVQTVLAVVVVVFFAAMGLDPVLNLFTWVAQVSVLGVLTMMAITSFAVIAYFRKLPGVEPAWKVLLAPLVSGVVMAAIALYTLIGFGSATGTVAPLSFILPGLVPAFGVLGYLIAAKLEKADPARFANMGANRD